MEKRSKKRILIITYEMIPFNDNWGGCQRMYYLAEAFVSNGQAIWVASSKLTRESNYFERPVNFGQIIINHPIKSFQSTTITKIRPLSVNFIKFLKKLIKNIINKLDRFLFNEPGEGIGIYSYFWVRKAYNEIKQNIVSKDIDTLIISGPPFTLFFLAKKIKKSIKTLKIILDYRDPWNLWNKKKYPSISFERKYLKFSDLVVVNTDSFCNAMKKNFEINKCETIFNGYSAELWSKVKPQKIANHKIIISYIGTIHFKLGSYRDTTELLKAYERIQNKDLFEIRFIGVDESSEVKELRTKFPKIAFMKKVSVVESLELMQESHFLLNVHTASDESSKYLIGGKIFDYLRSGNTIISINNSDSYEHKFLQGRKAILCINDHNEILKIFNRIINETSAISDSRNNPESENDDILIYSRENQNQKYIALVNSL